MTPLPYAYLRVDRRSFQPGDAVEFCVRDAEGRQIHRFEVVGPDSQDAWSAVFPWGLGYTVTYHHRGRSTLELTYSIHEVGEPGKQRADGREVAERAEIEACLDVAHEYLDVAEEDGDHPGEKLARAEIAALVEERQQMKDTTR